MISLKTVILMLLNGEEVVITDDLKNYYEVKIEKIPEAVDFAGETTLIIHSQRLKG